MAYENVRRNTAYSENPLCDRLRQKFSNRGIAFDRGTAAAINKTITHVSPFEDNTAKTETSRGLRYNDLQSKQVAAAGAYTRNKTAAIHTIRSETAYSASIKAASAKTPFQSGAFSGAYERAAHIRGQAASFYNSREIQKRREAEEANKAKKKQKSLFGVINKAAYKLITSKNKETDSEIKVDSPPFPKALTLMLVISTMVVMVLIYSISQLYETKNEVAGLQRQRDQLLETREELTVKLEIRDDLKTIENIAVDKIGMVKSDYIQAEFVKIGGGDKLEVTEENTGEDDKDGWGVFSTMMSSFGENWGRLMEYID